MLVDVKFYFFLAIYNAKAVRHLRRPPLTYKQLCNHLNAIKLWAAWLSSDLCTKSFVCDQFCKAIFPTNKRERTRYCFASRRRWFFMNATYIAMHQFVTWHMPRASICSAPLSMIDICVFMLSIISRSLDISTESYMRFYVCKKCREQQRQLNLFIRHEPVLEV